MCTIQYFIYLQIEWNMSQRSPKKESILSDAYKRKLVTFSRKSSQPAVEQKSQKFSMSCFSKNLFFNLLHIILVIFCLESMCLDFSTVWNSVGLINLPPAAIKILALTHLYLSLLSLSILSLNVVFVILCYHFLLFCFHWSFPLCLSHLQCLCISGRRWPNSSLKQRHSIYMQIRRRYALLKHCLF